MRRKFEVGHQIGAAGDDFYLGGYGMLGQQSHGVAESFAEKSSKGLINFVSPTLGFNPGERVEVAAERPRESLAMQA